MRRMFPGWDTSNRGSGSRNGTTPFFSISHCVGAGTVFSRSGAPHMLYASPCRARLYGTDPLL